MTHFWRQLKIDKSSSKTKKFLFFLKKEFKQDQASATKFSSFVIFFPWVSRMRNYRQKTSHWLNTRPWSSSWMPMPTAITPTLTSWAPYRRCSCAYNNLLKIPVKRTYTKDCIPSFCCIFRSNRKTQSWYWLALRKTRVRQFPQASSSRHRLWEWKNLAWGVSEFWGIS
jgi:hypothetical protein